jgi:hypothetical protein
VLSAGSLIRGDFFPSLSHPATIGVFALSLVVLVALLSTIVTHPPVFLSFVNWELFRGVI